MTESASVREGRIGPENGHALTRAVPRAGPATYKVDAGNEVEWTVNGITTKSKLNVTPTELELTDDANRTITYKRK
jgi:plastocyanin